MAKHPNINASLYDGEVTISVECSCAKTCPFKRFFCEPPEPEDECGFLKTGGNCASGRANLAAMQALKTKLEGAIKELEVES